MVKGAAKDSPAEVTPGDRMVRAASSKKTALRQSKAADSTRQAAQATDPIAGQTANIEDNSVGPIAVAGCTVPCGSSTTMVASAATVQPATAMGPTLLSSIFAV